MWLLVLIFIEPDLPAANKAFPASSYEDCQTRGIDIIFKAAELGGNVFYTCAWLDQ